MFKRLINDRWRFGIRHLGNIQSNIGLAEQMKIFNDKKQFEKSLHLFEKFQENNKNKMSHLAIIQGLKACSQLGDLQRGLNIQNLLSSSMKKNPVVLTSLIHFYSKLFKSNNIFFLILEKKCNVMMLKMLSHYLLNHQRKPYLCMDQ
jgi:hypothetical protein